MRWLTMVPCLVAASCDAGAGTASPVAPSSAPSSAAAASGNPFSANALPASERFRFEATVVERIRAGSYLYLRVEDGAGRASWVATLAATAPETAQVSVLVMARAEAYHSRLLDRDFAPLLFGVVRAIGL